MKNELNAYLTFALGEEKFAIPVEHVQEVVEYGHVTKVPQAPSYMLGIINLRGKVLPLMDTKIKLGLPATVVTGRSRILVLDLQTLDGKDLQVGALVVSRDP
jgi:purine-binding chemotaxis protein CheW